MRSPEVSKAIEKVGGSSALARLLNIKPQAVSQWEMVPYRQLLAVERVTNIPRHELRPDLFANPLPSAAAGEASATQPTAA